MASTAAHITPRLLASTTRNIPAPKSGVSTKNSRTRAGVVTPAVEVPAEIARGVEGGGQRHDRDQQNHPRAERVCPEKLIPLGHQTARQNAPNQHQAQRQGGGKRQHAEGRHRPA